MTVLSTATRQVSAGVPGGLNSVDSVKVRHMRLGCSESEMCRDLVTYWIVKCEEMRKP